MEAAPQKGTEKGDFFYHQENPFRALDEARQPNVFEAEEELETNVLFPRVTR
jgi:hypothetical protein